MSLTVYPEFSTTDTDNNNWVKLNVHKEGKEDPTPLTPSVISLAFFTILQIKIFVLIYYEIYYPWPLVLK